MSDGEIGFEEQLAQEAAQREREEESKGRTRVDEDGSVMEWDPDKKAWFPKIDADFIAKYQMSYGSSEVSDTTASTPASTASTASTTATSSSAPPAVTDPAYYDWYYSQYPQAGSSSETPPTDTESKEYAEWYKKYYEYYYSQKSEKDADKKDGDKEEDDDDDDSGVEKSDSQTPSDKDSSSSDKSDAQGQEYSDYWSYYYNYYGYENQEEQPEAAEAEKDKVKDNKKGKGKGKIVEKRKDPVWFDADEKQHTNVYVSNLPTDITEQEYEELMKKCGLIMLDPKTRKLKLKLYQNADGSYKGDGRCCYIKSESVDLALQVLDEYDVRGNTISVERAKFTMKGDFDAKTAKRRKLTNREKKRLREKQEKLFDWRPDKPAGGRGKHEKTVVIKNVFDPKEFDKDPGLINEIRNDMRDECGKYGDVRKVVVHDRHADGVVSVTMREPEEADICLEAVNGRWFGGKQLQASTWDGKTKYVVEESEGERDARLKQWENFLEGSDGAKQASSDTQPVQPKAPKEPESTPAASEAEGT